MIQKIHKAVKRLAKVFIVLMMGAGVGCGVSFKAGGRSSSSIDSGCGSKCSALVSAVKEEGHLCPRKFADFMANIYKVEPGTDACAYFQSRAVDPSTESKGFCATAVTSALRSAGFQLSQTGNAKKWNDLLSQQSADFRRLEIDNADSAPVGAVLVYGEGTDPFFKRFGHIEVKAGPQQYCSDYCSNGSFQKRAETWKPKLLGAFVPIEDSQSN